jgi:hypothetical protein
VNLRDGLSIGKEQTQIFSGDILPTDVDMPDAAVGSIYIKIGENAVVYQKKGVGVWEALNKHKWATSGMISASVGSSFPLQVTGIAPYKKHYLTIRVPMTLEFVGGAGTLSTMSPARKVNTLRGCAGTSFTTRFPYLISLNPGTYIVTPTSAGTLLLHIYGYSDMNLTEFKFTSWAATDEIDNEIFKWCGTNAPGEDRG